MAGQARDNRDEWEVKLISAIEGLNVSATAESVNKRVIIGKIKKVENAFEKLERAHAQYCQKAKIGLGSTDSAEYLRGQVKLKENSVTAAQEAIGEDGEEAEAKVTNFKLESELFQLSIDIEGKAASLSSLATTSLLTREQYGSIMDMLGEGKDQLLRYLECAEEIQEGAESSAAEKVKTDAPIL